MQSERRAVRAARKAPSNMDQLRAAYNAPTFVRVKNAKAQRVLCGNKVAPRKFFVLEIHAAWRGFRDVFSFNYLTERSVEIWETLF